jgi:hypothetical protein
MQVCTNLHEAHRTRHTFVCTCGTEFDVCPQGYDGTLPSMPNQCGSAAVRHTETVLHQGAIKGAGLGGMNKRQVRRQQWEINKNTAWHDKRTNITQSPSPIRSTHLLQGVA